MSKFIYATVILILIGTHSSAQYQLEETLGAPYVSSIHSSQDAKHLAWVVNERGIRNIWYTQVDNISPRQLTSYGRDDGLSISQLCLTGDYLIYVRGNGNNRSGYPANPASLPLKPQRHILRLQLEDLSIDTIASGAGPVLGPEGEQMVFAKGEKVFYINSISAPKIKPRVLFEVRNSVGSLSWSPDGKAIAFISQRGDHSFAGYFSIPENKIFWMAPALHFDEHPVWSPDGSHIAFLRRPGSGKDDLLNIMGGWPFEIVVADTKTGQGTSIWSSPADDGGFSHYYPEAPIRWTANNKILFYSEHDGWNHIYSIDPDGGNITDLTPGECEVENHSLSPDHAHLYYVSNCNDINRRHIWQVNIASGRKEMITGTDMSGIQTNPIALHNKAIAYREGKYNTPTTAIIQKGGQKNNLVDLPGDFPGERLVVPEAVVFEAADGWTIHGQLFAPKNIKDQCPAVIFMHGGPIRQMLLGYHYSAYYANAYILNQFLASRGYVVLSVNYRAGIGYGRKFRRAENQGPRGASEYKDIIAAGKYLQSRKEVDPHRIGLWGGSYGGYLTAMGLAKNSDMFKAGVDLHGVHDWSWRGRDFSPGGAWGISAALMDKAYHSSPISELQYWSSPVLVITGDDDRNVMFGQSIDLKNKLDKLGVHNEFLIFPDEVHGFLRYESWLRAYRHTVDFFNRFLKQ